MKRRTLGSTRCEAKSSRTGQPCQRWAILGGTVCPTHGGSAKQVQFSASERIRSLVPLALKLIEQLIQHADQDSVSLSASKDMLDRAGHKAAEKLDINATLTIGRLSDTELEARIAAFQTRARGIPRPARGTAPPGTQD